MALLSVRGLRKQFGGLAAVDNVDFDLTEGEITSLIGPNGAGKTTTINLITGFLQRTSGTIEFEGRDIGRMPAHKIVRLGLVRTSDFTGYTYVHCGRSHNPRRPFTTELRSCRWLALPVKRACLPEQGPGYGDAGNRVRRLEGEETRCLRQSALWRKEDGRDWRVRWPHSRKSFSWTSLPPG